jgi:GNAT superfamily N-acetyltransferase
MATTVVPLDPAHEVEDFDCGNDKLNEFLRATARQHQRRLISKTYVLVDVEAPTRIMGFYTLALRRMVASEDLPAEMGKRLPREIPAFSLARLAMRQDLKGQGYGEYMLVHAIHRVARVASEVGGYAIFVDAKSEDGASFYKQYGFVPMPDNPLILCLPLAQLPKEDLDQQAEQ